MAKQDELAAALGALGAEVANLKNALIATQQALHEHTNEDREHFQDVSRDFKDLSDTISEKIHGLELLVADLATKEELTKIQLALAGQTSWWDILRTVGNFLLLTALSYIAYRLGFSGPK